MVGLTVPLARAEALTFFITVTILFGFGIPAGWPLGETTCLDMELVSDGNHTTTNCINGVVWVVVPLGLLVA